MKYVRGFLMAWGMFCWIPCPYKEWREEDRDAQIGMLPLIGAFIGGITCLIGWCLGLLGAQPVLAGAVLTGVYFLLTGFIHLDGFMDCSDAVMPRHPEMEERRRILKDSHVGAFGVICLVLMLLIVCAGWTCLAERACSVKSLCSDGMGNFRPWIFMAVVMIAAVSRTVASVSVLKCRPMETSQYASVWTGGEKGAVAISLIWGVLFTGAAVMTAIQASRAEVSTEVAAVIAAAAVTLISAIITGAIDRKKLGGMNGDISGHVITTSEMLGLLALALLM